MTGEKNLRKLIEGMSPSLRSGDYVFCTVEGGKYGDHCELNPVASVLEPEGLTLVLEKAVADEAGLEYSGEFRCVTLLVHSSLEAVGLTAAISGELCKNNISANIVAGYFHDHVFVQAHEAERACAILGKMRG